MLTFGEIVDMIVKDELLSHKIHFLRSVVQQQYYEICQHARWPSLESDVELDMADAADSSGVLLPANLCCADIVVRDESDESNIITYLPRTKARVHEDGVANYTWHYTSISSEPRWSGVGADVKRDGSTVTLQSAPGAPTYTTLVGEYFRFASLPGFYEITAENAGFTVFTITPTFKAPSIVSSALDASTAWRIRPAKTRKLSVYVDGEFDDDAVVKVYYAAYPPPLYTDDQDLMIESFDLIYEKVMSIMAKSQTAKDGHILKYNTRLAEEKVKIPDYTENDVPRDQHNQLFKFSNASLYTER